LVKKLVEKGANIYARTNWGYTALFYAVIKDKRCEQGECLQKRRSWNSEALSGTWIRFTSRPKECRGCCKRQSNQAVSFRIAI